MTCLLGLILVAARALASSLHPPGPMTGFNKARGVGCAVRRGMVMALQVARPVTLRVAAASRRSARAGTILTSPESSSAAAPQGGGEARRFGRSRFFWEVARRRFLTLIVVAGFDVGLVYRAVFNSADERTPGNFFLSGIHGAGLALTILVVQIGFASTAHSRLGAALRRLPLAAEIVVRALVMTAALTVVASRCKPSFTRRRFSSDGLRPIGSPSNCRELSRSCSDCRWSLARPSRFGGWSAGRCSRARCSALITGQPGGADRDVPRPRPFDAPRRSHGRAQSPRPRHPLFL
jgi:hypothetical protein